MRLVTQHVSAAHLEIDHKHIAAIDHGLVVFVGFTHDDTIALIDKAVKKLLSLRIFPDQLGKTNLTIHDVHGSLLIVPNFTLYADVSESRRPAFTQAMPPLQAAPLFEAFFRQLQAQYAKVQQGQFGANMTITVVNEGPSTLIVDIKL
jgi:D-tyrosyl-tRNA(Tyr) deacylase